MSSFLLAYFGEEIAASDSPYTMLHCSCRRNYPGPPRIEAAGHVEEEAAGGADVDVFSRTQPTGAMNRKICTRRRAAAPLKCVAAPPSRRKRVTSLILERRKKLRLGALS